MNEDDLLVLAKFSAGWKITCWQQETIELQKHFEERLRHLKQKFLFEKQNARASTATSSVIVGCTKHDMSPQRKLLK